MRNKRTIAWFTACLLVGASFLAYGLIGPSGLDRTQDYTWSGAQTFTGTIDLSVTSLPLENDETIANSVDGEVEVTYDDDAVELGNWQLYSSNTSTSDNDYFRHTWAFEDSNSAKVEGGWLTLYIDDVTSTTKDSHLSINLLTDDSATVPPEVLDISGAAISPSEDDTVDLGASGSEFKDAYVDGTAYVDAIDLAGTAITATGAEINLLDGFDILQTGTVDVNNGQTSGTDTVTGLDTGDTVIVTPNEDIGSATKWYATATANTITVTVDQDPETTVTFHYIAIGNE